MKAAVLALTLMLTTGGLSNAGVIRRTEVVEDHGWRLVISQDAFSGKVQCRLHGSGMRVDGGWVVFSLGRAVDTSDAYVRIDEAPARRVRDLAPSPYRADWSADEAVFNPSGGEVAVPATLLLHGKYLWVRPSQKASVRRFRFEGLDHVRQVAADRGC